MRFRADPPAARATVALEDVTLIFHRPSGQTHVVASPVPDLLDALAAGPADAAALAARLSVAFDMGEDATEALAARLAELAAAGLIQPA